MLMAWRLRSFFRFDPTCDDRVVQSVENLEAAAFIPSNSLGSGNLLPVAGFWVRHAAQTRVFSIMGVRTTFTLVLKRIIEAATGSACTNDCGETAFSDSS